ncbi:MAG: MlaD family protein, partial [Rhodococcus sp. (in: high G+C Gram-positive bacteria)]|uniref:MlaD family protein n=1 Tax=Rhodococcus sp. TaxID=1831 RepID=UPI003BAEF5F2
MQIPKIRKHWAVIAVAAVAAAAVVLTTGWRVFTEVTRTSVTAYFTTANGLYEGDEVLVLGIRVGSVDTIEP